MKKLAAWLGRSLRDYVQRSDKLLLLVCVALSTLSCVLIWGQCATGILSSLRPLKVQAFCSVLGILAALLLSTLDYHVMASLWKLHQPIAYGLVLLTFTSLGVQVSEYVDDRNWLDLPGLPQFQPSELLKISFIITFAYHLSKVKEQINDWRRLIPLLLHGALPVLLIHFQGDDGSAVVMLLIFCGMIFAAGLSWKIILPIVAAIPPAMALLWMFLLDTDKKNRILALVSPSSLSESELNRVLWQQLRGEIALGNGGLWGNGILSAEGQSRYVPEVHNDFMFSYVGEAFGFVGCLGVLLLLLVLCLRLIHNARNASDDLGQYICVGVFSMLAAQIAINIGMNLGLMPVIGITLPFLSAGGTSVATLYLSIGVVLSVYNHRRNNLFRDR